DLEREVLRSEADLSAEESVAQVAELAARELLQRIDAIRLAGRRPAEEIAAQVQLLGVAALQLAARGLGEHTDPDRDHVIGGEPDGLLYRLAYRAPQRLRRLRLHGGLEDDHQ